MTFINTIPAEAADAEVAAMYRRQQSAWGYVPNYAKAFCHRPEVMVRWGKLLAEIKRPMGHRLFEFVTFVAAVEMHSTPCALAHGKALGAYFSSKEIVLIAAQKYQGVLSKAEIAVADFTKQIVRDACSVTKQQVTALKDHGFSDGEIFDIAATAAGRAFFTKLLDGLGVQMDSAFGELDPAIRVPLTVGREIGKEPVTVMRNIEA